MKNIKKLLTITCLALSLLFFSNSHVLASDLQIDNEPTINTQSEAEARSYSSGSFYWHGGYGTVGLINIAGYPLWRNDMTITVSGFNSETDIRIIIRKNNTDTIIFDTYNTWVGCLNTSGTYSIDVNLPPANSYQITCDIYGSNVSAGTVTATVH